MFPISPAVWGNRSFLIEMKPRSKDYASLFVDCPLPTATTEHSNNSLSVGDVELVKIGNNALEINDESECCTCIAGGCVCTVDSFKTSTCCQCNCGDSAASSRSTSSSSVSNTSASTRYTASFSGITLVPNTIRALTWVDAHRRLFMCKLEAYTTRHSMTTVEEYNDKTFDYFENELRSRRPLVHFLEELRARRGMWSIYCRNCNFLLYSDDSFKEGEKSSNELQLNPLPDDNWLSVSASMEYFCGQSCGGGHGLLNKDCDHDHADELLSFSTIVHRDQERAVSKWLPSTRRILFSDSYVFIWKTSRLKVEHRQQQSNSILPTRWLACAKCEAQLGTILRIDERVQQLHIGAIRIATLSVNGESGTSLSLPVLDVDPLSTRFLSFERFFAWMLISHSESQSSMKMLVRTSNRRPYMLIWIMEPYVIMTSGHLSNSEPYRCVIEAEDGEQQKSQTSVASFPCLKVLYKIYDEQSAASDPRANGADSSVGIVDLPFGCCLELSELLLNSSHALPPTLRAVGQLYVGFLRMGDPLKSG